jgi:hypothetical protein
VRQFHNVGDKLSPTFAADTAIKGRFSLHVDLRNLRVMHSGCCRRTRAAIYWHDEHGRACAAAELAEAARIRAMLSAAKAANAAAPYPR